MREQRSHEHGWRQLAELYKLLERRRSERAEVARLLQPLQETGLVVVKGEEKFLHAIDGQLDTVGSQLLEIDWHGDLVLSHSGWLGDLLDTFEWDVTPAVVSLLQEKAQLQEQIVTAFRDSVAAWEHRIDPLRKDLQRAIDANLPVSDERDTMDRLDGLVHDAERALRHLDAQEQIFADLTAALRHLSTEEQNLPSLKDRLARAARSSLHAELTLERRDDHSVSAQFKPGREPEEIQYRFIGSSTVVDETWQNIHAMIKGITDAVNEGLAREWGPQPTTHGDDRQDFDDLIRRMGGLMFGEFIPDDFRTHLEENLCSLTIETNALELPLELLHDEKGFLCLRRPVARLPLGKVPPRRNRPATADDTRRFLLVYADPKGNLSKARSEIEAIETGLQEYRDSTGAASIEVHPLIGEDATQRKLYEKLGSGTPYDVIHFAGHASFEDKGKQSGLVLHDCEFLAEKIQRCLRGRPLVFLNACGTARRATDNEPQQVESYFWEPTEGLASAFLYGGAAGCIGSLWPIYDEPASQFAIKFYKEVLEGEMIGEAMRQARLAMKRDRADSIIWASFVLYGNPTYRLFGVDTER